MRLTIFNSLTNKKEPFQPLIPGKVGMYVCGVTVYDMCHVGHARAYVTADIIYRYLKYLGYTTTYVRNFTDVDDKIINRANEIGCTTREITEKYIQAFYADMDALDIERPDIEPRVTEHIPDIINTVSSLIAGGHAYQIEGDVYFEVATFPDYGKLSKRNLEDLKAGARVEVDQRKKSPLDFALWKASKPGEPMWESPWGPGRPGWHIECSTMSTKYLGETFDLHGGGKDLVFPHHENEIAQSEASLGKPFCTTFFHNGFVNIDKEKMSKSLGNFHTVKDICDRYHPQALRMFLLTTHYRSPINFEVVWRCPTCKAQLQNESLQHRACDQCGFRLPEKGKTFLLEFPALEESQRRLQYLYGTLARLNEFLSTGATGAGIAIHAEEVDSLLPRFEQAMNDDFNAAKAMTVLNDAICMINELLDNKENRSESLVLGSLYALRDAIEPIISVLGVLQGDPAQVLKDLQSRALSLHALDDREIEQLVQERTAARKNKNFKRADEIRDQLIELGVELMDNPQGTSWRIKS